MLSETAVYTERNNTAPSVEKEGPQPDVEMIRRSAELFATEGAVIELRVPRARRFGFYDTEHLTELAGAAAKLSEQGAAGVYVTLNPVRKEIHDRQKNSCGATSKGCSASDSDVQSRRWLLVDCDPRRDADTNATDAEKAAAHGVARAVREHLKLLDWPAPVEADSGNGYHLLYRIEQPSGDSGLVAACLKALAGFNTDEVGIDTSVFNPSRITKLYGTAARKGPHTLLRPHRLSRLLHVPEDLRVVPARLLEELAEIHRSGTESTRGTRTRRGGDELTRAKVIERARSYLSTKDPAISGNGGHAQTLTAACDLIRGFGLRRDEARPLLRGYSEKCVPPWSDKELEHKLESAEQKAREEPHRIGEKLRGTNLNGDLEDGNRKEDDRPSIIVSEDEYLTTNYAVAAMSSDSSIFSRGGVLVHYIPSTSATRNASRIRRPDGQPRIAQVVPAFLRERLTVAAKFVKKSRRGDKEAVAPAHPPGWCVDAILARGTWPCIRPLTGLVTCPVLRPDGSVLTQPGYDHASGLLLTTNEAFNVIEQPTQSDLIDAVAMLRDVVSDFPFKSETHLSAWVACLLTLLARHAIDGCVPLFLVDSNVRGAGKGFLVDVASLIATGKTAARMTAPESDEEARKRITSIAMAGDPLCLIDNLDPEKGFGTPSLDAAVTSTEWKDRLLGRTEMVSFPLSTVWLGTGNNVSLKGDMFRRVCHIRLECTHEDPELRSEFKYPSLVQHVSTNRATLVCAGLTILRAYIAKGRPQQGLLPWGSFEEWSSLIRQAVVHAGLPDPGLTREALRESADDEGAALRTIIENWEKVDPEGRGLTARGILSSLGKPGAAPIREAFILLSGDKSHSDNLPGSVALGKMLSRHKGRVFAGKKIASELNRDKSAVWRVVPAS